MPIGIIYLNIGIVINAQRSKGQLDDLTPTPGP
jgi:hypothetical protein